MTEPPHTHVEQSPIPHRGIMIALLVVSLLANAIVGALLVWTRVSQSEYVRCAARYDQQFAEAYRARVTAATDVSGVMDELIFAVAEEDADKFAEALQHYVTLREAQDRERKDNPLPPLPETLCGEPR